MGHSGGGPHALACCALIPGRAQLASTDWDPEQFTAADHAALAGAWSWLAAIAGQALEGGIEGMVDDDLAYVEPWGFDPGLLSPPVLLLQGGEDRIVPASHGAWLAHKISGAELWLRPGDGHISVLSSAEATLDWLLEQARR
jgi:pimeloyl-ACP methyl ester carboxylesterase